MKASLLDIDADYLREVGTVSEACVTLMAKNMQQKAQTDYAIAFSGVAGPDQLEGQAVGTVWMALATPNGGTDLLQNSSPMDAMKSAKPLSCLD